MSARAALAELFELLEEYAPTWYSEDHRRRAMSALAEPARLKLSSVESTQASKGRSRHAVRDAGTMRSSKEGRHAAQPVRKAG